ncbi:YciI family protein [Vannielia litorea]|uniref:YCII-related domain-containing protein n=1 Tax=Vannielia litorea TaxID=1217970 RepID=A0A1N6H798_9RHOB|nr:YciI family protein [Vannielia litorea]SIO15701.1 YCII-related domain-containing protein [Vannielia litorea]
MPKFLYVYHGGKPPSTPEEGAKAMAAWGKWMSDHDQAITDPGNPVGMSKTVSSSGVADNGGANPTSGYTIVEAPDIATACRIAAENPMLTDGGSVEVAEIMPIEM